MIRKLLCLAFLLFVFGGISRLSAQDTICKINGEKVISKVVEVGNYDIRYKRYSSPDGPLYIIRKSEVWKIVYADGTTEYYNRSAHHESAATLINGSVRPYSVSMDLFDLMFGMFTFEGEYVLGKSGLVVRLPVSSGVWGITSSNTTSGSPDGYYYNRNKIFSGGPRLLLFPVGRNSMLNYYVGLTTEFGLVRRRSYSYNPVYPYTPTYHYYTQYYAGSGILNGLDILVSDRLNLGVELALGMEFSDTEYQPMGRMGIRMGWRFGKLSAEPKK